MGIEIGGIIEESHEEGRRIIDKVKIEHLSLIPDNGMMDALEFLSDDYIVRMPPVREYPVRMRVRSVEKATPPIAVLEDEMVFLTGDQGPNYLVVEEVDALEFFSDDALLMNELNAWDRLSDEALEEFEKLVEESESGQPRRFLDKIRYWSRLDWTDWLMGR